MRWMVLAASLWAGVAAAQAPDPEEKTGTERSADALLIGIPVAAFGLTFLLPGPRPESAPSTGFAGGRLFSLNGSPRHDLGLALLRTEAVTFGLKHAVNEERPNGKEGSFPSGHTALTFAGAEFIRKEYGWAWGTPAYVAASYVGWSRVETRDHWSQDVLAGAAIGILSNHDFHWLERWGWRVEPAMLSAPVRSVNPNGPHAEGLAPGVTLKLAF